MYISFPQILACSMAVFAFRRWRISIHRFFTQNDSPACPLKRFQLVLSYLKFSALAGNFACLPWNFMDGPSPL